MHIITGLSTGGAEMMLLKLLTQTDLNSYQSEVVSLTNMGPVGERIRRLGVPVRALNMPRGVLHPLAFARLCVWIRRSAPNVVQTWMYHADLIGGLAAKIAGIRSIVWGIRHSTLDDRLSKRSTIWTARVSAKLSRHVPQRIVCCSEASRVVHHELGYDSGKMVVVPNGFDLSEFRPDCSKKHALRSELGIPLNADVVGMVGRFNPQKNHRGFIQAAALLIRKHPGVYFVLCGDGISWDNGSLSEWIRQENVADAVHLLGCRADMPRVFAALDIYCNASSYGEGFPNVIGEAMASGVPCVVTDVGDSADIVGDYGKVVAPNDSFALAEALHELLRLTPEERALLGEQARCRIEEHFSLPSVVARYEQLYDELVAGESECH